MFVNEAIPTESGMGQRPEAFRRSKATTLRLMEKATASRPMGALLCAGPPHIDISGGNSGHDMVGRDTADGLGQSRRRKLAHSGSPATDPSYTRTSGARDRRANRQVTAGPRTRLVQLEPARAPAHHAEQKSLQGSRRPSRSGCADLVTKSSCPDAAQPRPLWRRGTDRNRAPVISRTAHPADGWRRPIRHSSTTLFVSG